jgi:hypothetical protein
MQLILRLDRAAGLFGKVFLMRSIPMRPNYRLLLASILFLCGVSILGVKECLSRSRQPASHAGVIFAEDAIAVREATFRKLRDETEVEEVKRRLRERLTSAVSSLPPDRALDRQAADALVEIACERIQLLLAPDFFRYRDNIAAMFRRSGTVKPDRETLMSQSEWNLAAERYRLIPIDPERAEVRALHLRGKRVEHTWAGGTTERLDGLNYYSNVIESPDGTGLNKDADVYAVLVPVETNDPVAASRVRVFLLLSFVRTQPGGAWMPWRAGLNDPTNQAVLIPPWL